MNNKKLLIVASVVIVILLAGLFFFFGAGKEAKNEPQPRVGVLDDGAILYRTVYMDKEMNMGYLFLPFSRDEEGDDYRFLNAAVDFNGDGAIAEYTVNEVKQAEWLVRNMETQIEAGGGNRYAVMIPEKNIGEKLPLTVSVFFSKEPAPAISWQEASAGKTTETTAITELKEENFDKYFSLDPSGQLVAGPAGFGFAPEPALAADAGAAAEPDNYRAAHRGIPDNVQDYNECVPTSIVNSFQWLAKKHGFEDRIPPAKEMVDEVKGDVEWKSGGTPTENIVRGKQSFIDRRALPLEAHQIGADNDPGIQYKIYEEINKGQAVELVMDFYNVAADGTLTPAGAHQVTVAGTSKTGPFRFLRIVDPGRDKPGSRRGIDVYELNGTDIIGYWPGKTRIRSAYAQSPVWKDGTLVYPDDRTSFVLRPGITLTPPEGDIAVSRSKGEFFIVGIDHPGDHMVGDRFTVRAVIRATDKNASFKYWKDGTQQTYTYGTGYPWTLRGTFKGGGNISPAEVKDTPPQSNVRSARIPIEIKFRCEKPGMASVKYTAEISWPRRGENPPAELMAVYGAQLDTTDTLTVESPPFRCYAALEPPADKPMTAPDEGAAVNRGDQPAPAPATPRATVVRSAEMAFDHVAPGQYSEVYLSVITEPGEEAVATLSGPGVSDTKTKTVTADANGQAYFTWKIVSYGTYSAAGNVNGTEFKESITVN